MHRLATAFIALFLFATCLTGLSQTLTGELIASQYDQWAVRGQAPNQYTWPSQTCSGQAGKQTFFVFTVGTPVNIIDADRTQNETVTPTAVTNGNGVCAITIAPVNQHFSFSISSATFGLQEAINAASNQNTVVLLTQDWYTAGGSSSIIAAAEGLSNVALVDNADLNCLPGAGYIFVSGVYTKQPCGASALPRITQILKGNGAGSGVAATAVDVTTTLGFTPLAPGNNLSEVTVPATALTNLGGVNKGGDTMTGPLNLPNAVLSRDAISAFEAATKGQVDYGVAQATAVGTAAQSTANGALPKAGGTMTGAITLPVGKQLVNRNDVIDVLSDTTITGAGNTAACSITNHTTCHDDGAAINAALIAAQTAKKKVLLPPMQSGAPASFYCDAYSSVTINVPSGVELTSASSTQYAAFNFCFPPGVTGFKLASSAKLRGIRGFGFAGWNNSDITTYVVPARFGGTGPNADCVVAGGGSVIEDVDCENWDADAFEINSDLTGGSDDVTLRNVAAQNNRGVNLHYQGSDASVGVISVGFFKNAQLFCVLASGFANYGNTIDEVNCQGDHNANGLVGTALDAATSVACVAPTVDKPLATCTATMSGSHTTFAKDVVTATGCSVTGFNGVAFPVVAGGSGTTFTFLFGTTTQSTTGCSFTYNPGYRVWSSIGTLADGGSVRNLGGAQIYLHFYVESTDGAVDSGSMVGTTFPSKNINPLGIAPNDGDLDNSLQGITQHAQPHQTNTKGDPNLSTFIGGYTFDNYGGAAWVAQNQSADKLTKWSNIGLRRTAYGNVNGWWVNQIGNTGSDNPGNGTLSMGYTPIAMGDKLTTTGRSNLDGIGTSWIPRLCIGSVAGGNPDACIITGSAAPTTGTWLVGDEVFNGAPTLGGTLYWRCITAGTPGTWEAVGGSSSYLASGALISETTNTVDIGPNSSTATGYSLNFRPYNTSSRVLFSSQCNICTNHPAFGVNPSGLFVMGMTADAATLVSQPITFNVSTGAFTAGASTLGATTATTLNIGSSTTITASTVYSPSITPTAVAANVCADQTFTVTGLATTDDLTALNPPSALGSISAHGYASATNTLTIHFCNVTAGSITPPAGVYRFRATH